LLPLDSATDFRNYRPPNDASMKLRFEAIRKCRKGRILRCRQAKGQGRRALVRNATSPHLSSPCSHCFEGSTAAFLDYQNLLPTITPLKLSSDSTNLTAINYQDSLPKVTPFGLSFNLRDSTPVDSSLLLLDGSSLSTRSFPPAKSTDSRKLGPSTAVAANTLKRNNAIRQSPGQHRRSALEMPHTCRTRHTDLPTLKTLLGNRYSDSYLRHVQSVFRYSLTNSEASSLISFPSCSSSTKSLKSAQSAQHLSNSTTSALLDARDHLTSTKIFKDSPAGTRLNVCEEGLVSYRDSSFPLMGSLTTEEQQVWNELVDDDQFELIH
jgi:hypothetical protein